MTQEEKSKGIGSHPEPVCDETEEVKEVYAYFGLAVYAAQCLEHGLVNAMVCLRLIPERRSKVSTVSEWEKEVDAFYDNEFRKTLGQMVSAFRQYVEMPADLIAGLTNALEIRNWLSHRYFRERAEDFMFPEGRKKMLVELLSSAETIRATDRQLESFIAPLLQKYRITQELLDEMRSQMLKNKAAEFAKDFNI
ncbi:MAG: hypothetical protein QY323_01370 [Patescibacteria group bacterium]|nr:MAG: hypothetical protein QY323_01370 [Patescibacteria group bacterium]